MRALRSAAEPVGSFLDSSVGCDCDDGCASAGTAASSAQATARMRAHRHGAASMNCNRSTTGHPALEVDARVGLDAAVHADAVRPRLHRVPVTQVLEVVDVELQRDATLLHTR